jgi:hypothetical protein
VQVDAGNVDLLAGPCDVDEVVQQDDVLGARKAARGQAASDSCRNSIHSSLEVGSVMQNEPVSICGV